MIIKHNSKNVKIKNVKKVSLLEEGIGLMFHRKEKCPAMLFEFNSPNRMIIHSYLFSSNLQQFGSTIKTIL